MPHITKKRLVVLSLVVLGLTSVSFVVASSMIGGGHVVLLSNNTTGTASVINNSENTTPEAKIESAKTEATIISVGDIFLHTQNLDAAYNAETKTYNFDSVFAPVANYFKNADLSTAWLGGVMSDTGPYTGYPMFKSPAALVDTLQTIGLDVAFRTNHTMDSGTKGLYATSEILNRHNIRQVAAHATEEDSKQIFVYTKGDLKIAYLGYIYGMNGLPIPKPWMVDLIDTEKIAHDIGEAKKQADYVIVALHFGNEYERYPNAWQKETAQKIADSGADMIIASHPHVIQPVETVTSADGRKVYVAYSLGNFYCAQRLRYRDAGVILKYTIEKTNEGTRLQSIGYLPTWVAQYKENGINQFQVLPIKKYMDLYAQGQAAFLSAPSYNRMKQTYIDTVQHLNNPDIGFLEEN